MNCIGNMGQLMTDLQKILQEFRTESKTEREKGTYFEELIRIYFKHEATYADLYSDIWMFKDWADEQGVDARDVGIDLVAKTRGTDEFHAIQCKFYAEDYKVQKSDIDSFFTASGQKPFTHRIIISTTNNWSVHAENALINQQPPIIKIDLDALEESQIDWSTYQQGQTVQFKKKNSLRAHQTNALTDVKLGFKTEDRGKLIMACGTGKTFTSLKIAEEQAGKGGRILFMVPSLSLLSQTLSEWTQQSSIKLHCFAVCSDAEVGKKRKKDDDTVQTFAHELRFPATTDASKLATEMEKRYDDQHMSVVFSTYHSIEVISKSQKDFNLSDFDLIICDEAHRTTGSTFEGDDESHFVKVHDADYLKSFKRLYMTATPRIYGVSAKASMEKGEVTLCSMDDQKLFGRDLHVITFSEAVKRDLLVDYKVIVLTVDAEHVSSRLQNLLKDENNTIKVDDAAKIVGCWKALSKHGVIEGIEDDLEPMRRAVAFCQVIDPHQKSNTHKVSSKQIAGMFQAVVEEYQKMEEDHGTLVCEAEHVDGSMNASQKEEKLTWLKAEPSENSCRILSNVRCLSEGVDVPALDAVLFLTPRNSQVDVVQSVGRVMRKAGPSKKRGYVILPVVIPTGMKPHEALNDNKTYRVVWEVLQALRSHDDRFDAMINKLDLVGKDTSKMEIIAVTDKVQRKQKKPNSGKQRNKAKAKGHSIGEAATGYKKPVQYAFDFEVGEIERALYAKVVQKCGNRHHWEDWANDIAKIANTHIVRIRTIISDPENKKEVAAFNGFADELRDDLNNAITNEEVIEMLAQHLITKPVFDALFEGYSFANSNPVSVAMQQVLDLLHEHRLEKEADTLEGFYASVKLRAEGIDSAEGKQKIVVELYDKFFRNAFPRMTERLGIVYTPVEVVDFIIHSVNDILKKEFGQTLGSKGVHIIDPFTGTGTFITRLLQSGLIKKEELEYKYQNEIHANEIVLLAYYIAAINIEHVYHDLVGGEYMPFHGICLTDTFQLYEKDDLISDLLVDNSERRSKQKKLDIRIIIGNPPYSVGQESANDENQNINYPDLDNRIRETYAKQSKATLQRNLYDSYIRSIRWASDRIGDSGVIGFVTNASFLEANSMDGLRKCLVEEYSNIYVFHLRGNARTSGEIRRKEKDNVFGQGTRTPIAITLFVKNPYAAKHGEIYYKDIGDYLSREEKLKLVVSENSIIGIENNDGWSTITPDLYCDWIKQRDDSFQNFIPTIRKKDDSCDGVFIENSIGVNTSRDAWVLNSSYKQVEFNMERMINFYNEEISNASSDTEHKPSLDPTKISWSSGLKSNLKRRRPGYYEKNSIVVCHYRPYQKQWLYFDNNFNERTGKMAKIFPSKDIDNRVICVSGIGAGKGFSILMSSNITNFHTIDSGQCFPLKLYGKENQSQDGGLFSGLKEKKGGVRDGISDAGLAYFQAAYPDEEIGKENLFYYIYGLLHSEEYRSRFADNLTKQLPRIPPVKKAKDFWAFSKAGRDLAELHVNYESVHPYMKVKIEGTRFAKKQPPDDFRVEKMKFGKNGKDKDKSTVIYNHKITISKIPLQAYDYIVNGKSALDWVMERQCVKTDKKSGIENDANRYAIETMKDASYPLNLFLRMITVSLETVKIVKGLPALDI